MELMLTLVIVGILSALAIPSYERSIEQAKVASAIADLLTIKLSIDRYRLNSNDAIPLSLAEINSGNKRDPWGNAYVFLNFSTSNGNGMKRKDHNLVPINSRYDLYSMGADGESVSPLAAATSRDDIIVANDGTFVGKASDY